MTTPTTPSDDLEAAAKVAAEGPGPLTLLADREWQDLCEKDDRTSPADYPEMCLITRNELGGIICEGFLLAKDQGAAAHRALEAKVVELVAERLALLARIEEVEGERDEAKADRNAHADHVLRVAREADDGMAALDDMDAAWEATGEIGNRKHLTLAEQIGSIVRERDAADARALSAEAAQARAEFLLAVMAATFDGPHGWWETRRLWHSAVQDNYENAYVEQTVADEWRKRKDAAEAALRASQEALGKAAEGLRTAADVLESEARKAGSPMLAQASLDARQTLAQVEGVEEHGASGGREAGHGALPMPTEPPISAGWFKMDTLPDVGRKFIALFNDGSGAGMFWRYDDGFIDQDGNDEATLGSSYDRWAYLPDDLEFWCETVAEDPMVLRIPTPPSGQGSGS